MNDKYSLFGLTEDCSDEEFELAYKERRAIYAENRFLEGEEGNLAAKKLTELDATYNEIKAERREKVVSSSDKDIYSQIENLIKEGKIQEAQQELDKFNERNSEWHYLQAVVFYKKNWNNESKKQLEIAMSMDPSNQKYKNFYCFLNLSSAQVLNKNFCIFDCLGPYS